MKANEYNQSIFNQKLKMQKLQEKKCVARNQNMVFVIAVAWLKKKQNDLPQWTGMMSLLTEHSVIYSQLFDVFVTSFFSDMSIKFSINNKFV